MWRRTALLLLTIHPAWAQYVISAHAGTIHFATGPVFVDGQPVETRPAKFTDLHVGQTLSTSSSRAEILLGPGVFLRLDTHSAARMLDTRLEDTRVEVLQGTALVEVVKIASGDDVHVILGPTTTGFKGIGLHRFNADSRQLRVFGGRAEVSSGDRFTAAERGAVVDLGGTLAVSRFDPRRETVPGVSPQKDPLHQWAARRSYQLYKLDLVPHSHLTNWEVKGVTPVPNKNGTPTDQDRFYIYNRDFGFQLYFVPPRAGHRGEEGIIRN